MVIPRTWFFSSLRLTYNSMICLRIRYLFPKKTGNHTKNISKTYDNTLNAKTLSITTLSTMAFSIMTFCITTFSIMTFSIMTCSKIISKM